MTGTATPPPVLPLAHSPSCPPPRCARGRDARGWGTSRSGSRLRWRARRDRRVDFVGGHVEIGESTSLAGTSRSSSRLRWCDPHVDGPPGLAPGPWVLSRVAPPSGGAGDGASVCVGRVTRFDLTGDVQGLGSRHRAVLRGSDPRLLKAHRQPRRGVPGQIVGPGASPGGPSTCGSHQRSRLVDLSVTVNEVDAPIPLVRQRSRLADLDVRVNEVDPTISTCASTKSTPRSVLPEPRASINEVDSP